MRLKNISTFLDKKFGKSIFISIFAPLKKRNAVVAQW